MLPLVSLLLRATVSICVLVAVFLSAVTLLTTYTYFTRPTPVYPAAHLAALVEARQKQEKSQSQGQGEDQQLVAVVTGSTGGIGECLARELFRRGFVVVLASRSLSKLQAVAADMEAQAERERDTQTQSRGRVDYCVLELADLDSVRDFVKWFRGKYSKLNFLVNNAGMHYADGHTMMDPHANIVTKQGYDQVFATNYLGHFLLSYHLVPMIKCGRVVNASSSYHFQSDGHTLRIVNGKPPDCANGANRDLGHKRRAYSVTKLANVLHANELQRRLTQQGRRNQVQAIAFCPGWVATGMIPQAFLFGKIIYKAAFPVQTGILSVMSALFEPALQGGEFVCNLRPPIFTKPGGKKILATLTKLGLRDDLLDIYAFFLSIVQNSTYGFNVFPCSDEGSDAKLAKDLYDWSEKELRAKGYIGASE